MFVLFDTGLLTTCMSSIRMMALITTTTGAADIISPIVSLLTLDISDENHLCEIIEAIILLNTLEESLFMVLVLLIKILDFVKKYTTCQNTIFSSCSLVQ